MTRNSKWDDSVIIAWLSQGLTYAEIERKLGISAMQISRIKKRHNLQMKEKKIVTNNNTSLDPAIIIILQRYVKKTKAWSKALKEPEKSLYETILRYMPE